MAKKKSLALSSAASELGKRGAKKGGIARANTLTPSQRSEIGREAVRARWAKAGKLKGTTELTNDAGSLSAPPPASPELPYSLFTGTLHIGDIEMECHVLNDLRRVFTQGQVVRALSGGRDSSDLMRYLRGNPLFNKDFFGGPIQFKIPANPTLANGLEATQLIEICDLYMEAEDQGRLRFNQKAIAKRAQILVRASAKVGIIALIDEATGYQEVRAKRALQLKLQAFIADEMQEWAIMFPEPFWLELARLEGVRYSPRSRPLRWGKYIMMFVYDAIDPDVGKELRAKNPNPRFLKNHHQWLKQYGRESVKHQITAVITMMKACNNMDDFRKMFAKVFQKAPTQQVAFDDLLQTA